MAATRSRTGRYRCRSLVVAFTALAALFVLPPTPADAATIYYHLCYYPTFNQSDVGEAGWYSNNIRNYRYEDYIFRNSQCFRYIPSDMRLRLRADAVNDGFDTFYSSICRCDLVWRHVNWVAFSDCGYTAPQQPESDTGFTCFYYRH